MVRGGGRGHRWSRGGRGWGWSGGTPRRRGGPAAAGLTPPPPPRPVGRGSRRRGGVPSERAAASRGGTGERAMRNDDLPIRGGRVGLLRRASVWMHLRGCGRRGHAAPPPPRSGAAPVGGTTAAETAAAGGRLRGTTVSIAGAPIRTDARLFEWTRTKQNPKPYERKKSRIFYDTMWRGMFAGGRTLDRDGGDVELYGTYVLRRVVPVSRGTGGPWGGERRGLTCGGCGVGWL